MTTDIKAIEAMTPEDQYEVRVQQLLQDGCTRSDAQGIADYEELKGVLLERIKDNINHHKPAQEMTQQDVEVLVDEALSAACLSIHERLRDHSHLLTKNIFNDRIVKGRFAEYINAEIIGIRNQSPITIEGQGYVTSTI